MVQHAKDWKPLPTRFHCSAGNITGRRWIFILNSKEYVQRIFVFIHRAIPEKGTLKLTIDTDACKNTKDEVNYLEHVQAFITVKSSRRGNTVIFLTSPLGTR